jgi:hypothetical protein
MHWDTALLVFILSAILRGNQLLGKLVAGHRDHERRIKNVEGLADHHGVWLTRIAPDKEPDR